MIKKIRQYRNVTLNEDGLPMLDLGDHNEDGLPMLAPSKKKEKIGSDQSQINSLRGILNTSQSQSPLGLLKNRQAQTQAEPTNQQDVVNYLRAQRTPEEIAAAQPSAANSRQLAYNAGQQKLDEIIATGGHNDPMAVAAKNANEAPDMQDRIKNYMANRFVQDKVDGVDAKQILQQTDFGYKGDDNLTAKTLRDKVAKYETATTPIKTLGNLTGNDGKPLDLSKVSNEYLDNWVTPDLQRAAIEYGIRKDPEFARDLKDRGIDVSEPSTVVAQKVGSFKTGQWMERMMNDPDVNAYLQKENPQLIPAFQRASQKLRTDNPDYGVNQVATEVSRAIQQSGYNNIDPLFNFYDQNHKEFANTIAQGLYRNDPESMAIWDKYIKDNQEKYIDAPSLTEGVAGGIKTFGQGIANTFTEPFKSASQEVKDKWNDESNNINANPEGFSGFMRNTGHALGTVLAIGATGGLGEGLGLSSTAANTSAIGAGFFGDNLKEAKQTFRDSPVKAYTSAVLKTGMFMALGNQIFPAGKLKQAFGEYSPEIDKVVEGLANGSITKETAKQQLNTFGKKIIDFAGGALSKNAKITLELTAADKVGHLADQLMGAAPVDDGGAEKMGTTFLSNLAIAGFAKYGEMKHGNELVQNSLDHAASNPLQTQRTIDGLNIGQAAKDQMKSNLNLLIDVKKKLIEDGIPTSQHSRFLFEALKEKVAKDELETPSKAPTGAFERRAKERVKTSQDIQERILNGEDVKEVGENEISKPIELNPELPEGYQLPDQQKIQPEVNIPTNEQNIQPTTKEAESIPPEQKGQPIKGTTEDTQGTEKVKEQTKPELGEVKDINAEDISDKISSSAMTKHSNSFETQKKRFENLKKLVDCIWT